MVIKLPRKEIESPAASLFGSEAMVKLFESMLDREGEWIQQAELSRLAKVDERTVKRLFDRLEKSFESIEVDKPYRNVKIYRIKAESNLSKALKLIFKDVKNE